MVRAMSHEHQHLAVIKFCLCHDSMNSLLIVFHTAEQRLSHSDPLKQTHVFHQILHHPVIFNPVDDVGRLDDHVLDPIRRHTGQRLRYRINTDPLCTFQLADDHPACKCPVYVTFLESFFHFFLDHFYGLPHRIQMACPKAYNKDSFLHSVFLSFYDLFFTIRSVVFFRIRSLFHFTDASPDNIPSSQYLLKLLHTSRRFFSGGYDSAFLQ